MVFDLFSAFALLATKYAFYVLHRHVATATAAHAAIPAAHAIPAHALYTTGGRSGFHHVYTTEHLENLHQGNLITDHIVTTFLTRCVEGLGLGLGLGFLYLVAISLRSNQQ